uniref:RAB44, member RAS onco family n=1 Tax=Saimiri boliviensis boliviensis TaxID=39432 RepID=A0A2K6SKF3_SAIBB
METGQRGSRKVRKLGSSRRRQTREPADGEDAAVAPEPESWSSQAAAELQAFFQDCGAKERGFVTREDLAYWFLNHKGQKGRLSLEEFSSGLKNIVGSSQSAQRLRRRKPLPSKRVSATTSFPALEEADEEEKEAFLAFMEQLGTGHLLPKQTEIWQLWGKLRQEEPQLAGNLAGFMAKMTSCLQEAQAEKEALELTLRKRDSDHHREVQQLYEEMEQQIQQEKQQLQAESDSRGLAFTSQMQDILEAKEREVQRLAEGQRELEAQLSHLRSTHQEAASENQQLREAKRDLAGRLEEVRGQLQVTKGRLDTARGRVSWQMEEKLSVPGAGEKAPDPQAVSPEEGPLPGLFGDNDDWDQLLSSFGSPPHGALQLCWSPPPSPRAAPGPETPRVVRQISISGPHTLLFGQEPPSDPDRGPRTPPGVPFSAKDSEGMDPDEQDNRQPVETQDQDANQESGSRPEGRLLWGGESGSRVAAAFKVLIPLEDGLPPQVNAPPPQGPAGSSKQIQASDSDNKGPGSWAPPSGAQPGAGAGPQEPTQTPPTMTEQETQPGPSPTTALEGVGPGKPPRQREALQQDRRATGSELGLGFQRARALSLGPAEPFQGLASVGPVPTERLEQGQAGPAVQDGLPEGLREARGWVLGLGELPSLPHRGLEEEPRAEEGEQVDRGGQDLSSEQLVEAHRLETARLEHPQQESLLVSLPSATPQARADAEAPAPGKPAPPPVRAQPGAGPQEATHTPPTVAEPEAQPRPPLMTTHTEEQGLPHSREPRAESMLEDPGTDSRGAGLTPPPGDPMAGRPQANPDYLFHVIFLGDSNVGKTSFLHLLHQNSFATGLTATVGVDFRVKTLLVDNKCFLLQLWDTAGQERQEEKTWAGTVQEGFLGEVWLRDMFCVQDAGADGVTILLLGNKMDCEEERRVPTEAGQQLAQELGVSFGECSAALGHNILEPMVHLARSLRMQEDGLKGSLVEVAPKRPPKRSGCCS